MANLFNQWGNFLFHTRNALFPVIIAAVLILWPPLAIDKSQSGYTDTENQRKREALENVLIPYRLDENYALLQRAGFTRIDTYFQWFNFACIIAIKV